MCGIASPRLDAQDAHRRRRWLEQGCHASLAYMARNEEARRNPALVLEGVRSILCCAINYNADAPKSTEAFARIESEAFAKIESEAFARAESEPRVWISRYAWGGDYHDVVRRMLRDLAKRLERLCAPAPLRWRACVDTAPLPERALAAQAGLGWIGKNGALIHERLGSYLFLGELLVNLDLPPDAPIEERCGDCHRCMDACPGQAIIEPRMIDCRRCVSYLTIEHRGEFNEAKRRALGRNVFGCDLCQDVCPWNRNAPITSRPEFRPRKGLVYPLASDLKKITPEEFLRRFKDSPLQRCGYEGLQRNLAAISTNESLP